MSFNVELIWVLPIMTRIKKGIDRKYSVLAAKAVFRLCTFAMVRYLGR